MKPFRIFLLGIVILSVIAYAVPAYRHKVVQLLSYSECDTPLAYKLGQIDQRFDLSTNVALDDISAATDIWSTAINKKLFVYSQTANLTVNFVYDQRQALDTAINQLNTKLAQNNTALQQQISDYKAKVTAFKERLASFQNTVNKYNRQGGASPSVYNDLISQQNQLKAQADALNAEARQLNLSTNDYNTGVYTLNQDINQLNSALVKKPEEGIYDGNNNTITIYFASSYKELLHTLAHEFGHALGMEHVNDAIAIMYPYTTSSIVVTSDDKQQLNYVCRGQSLFMHWIDEFDKRIVSWIQNFKQNFSSGVKQ